MVAAKLHRWTGLNVEFGDRFPPETVEELRRRGHALRTLPPFGGSGHAQVIMIHSESGAFVAGSDPRCDGCAIGW